MFGDNVANVIRDDLITSLKAVLRMAVNVLIESSSVLVQTLNIIPCGHFDFYIMHFLALLIPLCCPWEFNKIPVMHCTKYVSM